MELYLLKNLPAENLFLLLGILCNHEYHCICETLKFIAMKKLIKKPIGNREIMRNYFSTIGLVPIMKSKKRC